MESLSKPLVNKVAQSKLITFNLEDFYPKEEIVELDISPFLFKGLLLKEMDFRKSIKALDWSTFKNKILIVHCSTDAIIPVWAYALIATYAAGEVHDLFIGSKSNYIDTYYKQVVNQMDVNVFNDKMMVIKGCSEQEVPASAYAYICQKLTGVAKSIMYGEPCSTVPLYKKKKEA